MFNKKQEKSVINKEGLWPALELTAYIALVSTLLQNGNKLFGQMDNFLSPIVFLTIFVTSALISALIVFYKPYQLFVANKGKEALLTVISTAIWLAVVSLTFIASLILFK